MAKPKRAERRAANKAQWKMLSAIRDQGFRAASGEPVPDGVTPETWEMLRAGATCRAADLRLPDGVATALGLGPGQQGWADSILDQPPRKDGKREPEDAG